MFYCDFMKVIKQDLQPRTRRETVPLGSPSLPWVGLEPLA